MYAIIVKITWQIFVYGSYLQGLKFKIQHGFFCCCFSALKTLIAFSSQQQISNWYILNNFRSIALKF